jgi:mRNA-degrading endonuclease RelE of RelBE toxin-antitoxin system
MAWAVELAESVIEDLRWFGRRTARVLLREAMNQLAENPLAETRNMKALRPNPVAERELRLFGKYRVLFNVDSSRAAVVLIAVGEKRGEKLIVRGKEYEAHHEGDPPE